MPWLLVLIVICSFLLFPISLISLFLFIYLLSGRAAQQLGSPAWVLVRGSARLLSPVPPASQGLFPISIKERC